MRPTRRDVLAGMMAGSAEALFSGRFAFEQLTAKPGVLNLTLTALSQGILRIGISPANDPPHPEELGVVGKGWQTPLLPTGPAKQQTVAWGKFTLQIGTNPLSVTALEVRRVRQQIRFEADSTDVSFDLHGPVFGLGEGGHSFDKRGTKDAMVNGQNGMDLRSFGARLPIPWVMSPEGWGVFVGQPSGEFEFSQTEARFRDEEATSTRNVYLLLGDTPADVLREYANLTGFPQMPPLWSFGYQQSHRTLESAEEILNEAKTFREKKLPVDAFIFLGTGFTPSGWNSGHGSFTFNERVFPDPPAQIKALHAEHLKVILHMVPPGDFHGGIGDTGPAAEMPGDAATYWAKHEKLAANGVDGWWPDEAIG
jgi:alpha-glucosidase/alpha-D-xyloside xylohydrolase